MSAEIMIPQDQYEALMKDPLYRERIEIGLRIGVVEIEKNEDEENARII